MVIGKGRVSGHCCRDKPSPWGRAALGRMFTDKCGARPPFLPSALPFSPGTPLEPWFRESGFVIKLVQLSIVIGAH